MRIPRFDAVRKTSFLAVTYLAVAALPRLDAAPKPAPAPATNEIVVARSIFVIPTARPEGCDPFYPRSNRVYTSGQAAPVATNQTTTVSTPVSVELHLNGISGTAAHPLAIINYRTFGIGEQGEVVTGTGRVHIRCLEIRKDTVIVQAPGETKVLHLRQGAE
jgi:hypothetical protein